MARSENPELKKKLGIALQKHLYGKGLEATSYQTIADEVGISRALVQHYCPRKMDFAIDFLQRLLSATASILGIDKYAENKALSYSDAYLIGCLYYGFLLNENGGRHLLFDILKNRELSDELMYLHYQWGLTNLDSSRPEFESRSQEVIETWGGFYELMYYSIKYDLEIDVSAKTVPLLAAFAEEGNPEILFDKKIEGLHVDSSLLKKIKNVMDGLNADLPRDKD